MKNQKKNYFSVLISFILLIAGSVFLCLPKQTNNIASADTLWTPAYLTVYKNNVISGDTVSYEKTGSFVSRNDAVFLNSNQVLIFRLAHPSEQTSNAMMPFNLQVFVDNQALTHSNNFIIDRSDNEFQYIEMVLDLYKSSPDPEGKYDITVSFMEYTYVDGAWTNAITRELSYSFYLYKTATYYSGGLPAVAVSNVTTYLAGSSSSYARTHEFHYTNELEASQRLNLPVISYNTNKYELFITKTISGMNTESKVTVNSSGNLVQTNEIVKLHKVDNMAYVTFNDIGTYYVQYLFLYNNNGTVAVEYFANINSQTKPDRVNLFGFQIYHADINSTISSARKEFKVFKTDNTLEAGYQTDVTYSLIENDYKNGAFLTPSGDKYILSDISNENIQFNNSVLTVPSTNQAPVDFNYNASIVKSESFYLKLDTYSGTLGKNLWTKYENYNGASFTDVGVYLLRITYSASISTQTQDYTQWFFFEITNETPSFKILNSTTGDEINSNTFTKDTISVQFNQSRNPFDSASALTVYSKAYSAGTYANAVSVPYDDSKTFSANSNYRVVLQFGKNLTKSKISYFTIDNTEITGFTARNIVLSGGYNVKSTGVPFFTNQNAAVEWNEKQATGNTITAEYKFIPIVANTENFSSTELQSYYEQGYFVPVSYHFDYQKTGSLYPVLKTVPYSNTLTQTTNVSTEGIFTQQGMYIFRLVDKAGNEAYGAFVIDKTNPVVLQKMTASGNYITDFSSLNLIAEDSHIQWGKYKAIKTNLDLTGIDFASWTMIDHSDMIMDSWLLTILRNKARLSQQNDVDSDFKVVTVNTSRNLYLTPRIKTTSVMIQIGQTKTLANATNYGGGALIDEYSYAITVAKTVGGVLNLYENTYSFFVSDESKTDSGDSTIHSIQVSTDISKTSVRFATTVNGNTIYDSLVKHSYEVIDTETSTKSMYYMPINYNVMQLQYLKTPTENAIEVDKILVYYYPYISNYLIYRGSNSMLKTNMYYTLDELVTYTGTTNEAQGLTNNTQYTLEFLISKNIFYYSDFVVGRSYVLAKEPRLYTIYDYSTSTNIGALSGGFYVWNINTITNTATGEVQTQQGKYTIVRTYRTDLAGVEDIVGERYDFMTRTITFIVDREDVVSSPVTLNITANPNGTPNSVLLSQVGGASYIEVLAGSGNADNLFTELYRARNYDSSSGSLTNILETNKLPVKISIPLFKFGQVITDNFIAFSNNLFYTSSLNSYINSFEMLISVKHLTTGVTQTNTYSIRLSATVPTLAGNESQVMLDNGLYLITTNVTNGYIVLPMFTQVGQYEVKISQNNSLLKGNKSSLTFYMNIVNIAPVFEVEDTFGNTLEMDSSTQTYYTNKNTLRVVWTDSTNVFNAKIDVNKLTYFDGVSTKTVPANQVVTSSNGYTHYFDINITNYSDGTGITVILSYEGKSTDYPSGSFSTTKVVRIDRIAPMSSLNKLIAKADESTVINASNLRQGHNQTVGYNKTTTEQNSIYRNFAFAVDISDFNSLIYSSADKIHIYYKKVPNKYSETSYVELDPSSETALTQLLYSNQYTAITKAEDYTSLETEMYYEIAEIDFAGNITVYSIYLTDYAKLLSDEQALKNDDSNYKKLLDNELKVVSYSTQLDSNAFISVLDISNALNSYKIYAKNNFTLQSVNAYGYKWAVITYNNVKYLQSPRLSESVYRIGTSGTTEVALNTINLSLSRYNYSLTIKNMPKANISLSVIVSNNELTITQPTGTNEKLLITRVNANDTEFVNWQSVEIYEFRNGTNVRYTKFTAGTASPVSYWPEIEGFNLASYATVQNITTFTINAIVGSHYRYKITDNFGKIYTLHHLYGQEYVKPIVNNDNLSTPLTTYEEDALYYVSDTGYTFTYFPSITNVTVTVFLYRTNTNVPWVSESRIYTITDQTLSTAGIPYFTVTRYASYTSINMIPDKDYTDRFEGVKVIYIIEATTNILDIAEDNLTETEIYRFKVYNLVPTTQLKGKNRQNLNDLLLNSTNLTSEPITVEFVDSSGFDYPVSFYVSFNNQNPVLINSGTTFSASGTYTIIKRYTSIMNVFEIAKQTFTISDSAKQFYTVVVYSQTMGKYIEISPTGSPYLTEDSGTGTTIYEHYIVNTLDFKINVNSSQYVSISEDATEYYTSIKRGISTYIRTISNFNAEGNPTINYIRTQIAISYIPSSNKIANSFYYTDSQGNQVNLTYSEKTYALEKDVDTANSVIVSWNNYYMIAENKVIAEIRYGSDNQLIDMSKVTTKEGTNSISITRSGYYQFVFRDLSGNTHKFDYNAQIQNSTNTYDFIFLKDVIFTVNGASPIPYAIYNGTVQIAIPSYTLNYYDSNARPQISVTRNGLEYTGYTASAIERKYTFTEQGLYKIIFQAKRGQKQIKEDAYYFEIIKSNEVANAFSIEEYENYYIEQIKKDGTDITRQLSTTDLGKLIYITKNGTTLPYLRNLFISLYDEQTGAGIWEVTINTNNDLHQTFTYTFRVNSVVPPISVSLEEGASTTKVITVNFNARNLYDEVGDAIIKIGNRQIVLNETYFAENNPEVYTLEITEIGDTYIQILTPSGRLLYTYRVTRDQPLNTVAIIIIVVSSLAAVGLTVMFVLLRRKMRIR